MFDGLLRFQISEKNGRICGFHWTFGSKKCFSFRGALPPWPSDQGLCPWTPLEAPPPEPPYRLALRTLATAPLIAARQLVENWLSGPRCQKGWTALVYTIACHSESHRGTRRLSLWRQPWLTTSAVASRIASPPTSSSGLSRPSRAAVGNFFCRHLHRHQTYNAYCTLIYGVYYCHINLSKMLNLTRSLTLTLTLTANPKPYH